MNCNKKVNKECEIVLPGGFLVNPSPYNDDFFSQTTVVKLQTWIAFSHVNCFRSWLNVTFNIFRKPFWGQLTLLHPSVVARCALTAWLRHHWLCSNPSFYLPRSRPYLYQHPVAEWCGHQPPHSHHGSRGFESPCHTRLSASPRIISSLMSDSGCPRCSTIRCQQLSTLLCGTKTDWGKGAPSRRAGSQSSLLAGQYSTARTTLRGVMTYGAHSVIWYSHTPIPFPHVSKHFFLTYMMMTHTWWWWWWCPPGGDGPGVSCAHAPQLHNLTPQPAPAESLWSSRNSVPWLYCIMGWWCGHRWCLLWPGPGMRRLVKCLNILNTGADFHLDSSPVLYREMIIAFKLIYQNWSCCQKAKDF